MAIRGKYRSFTEQGMEKLQSFLLFTESRSKPYTPYTGEFLNTPRSMTSNEFVGRVLARFERSTLPGHEGTRTVAHLWNMWHLLTMVILASQRKESFIGELGNVNSISHQCGVSISTIKVLRIKLFDYSGMQRIIYNIIFWALMDWNETIIISI